MMMIASGVEVVGPSHAPSTMIPTRPPACAHHSHHTLKVHGVSQCRLTAEAATAIFLAKRHGSSRSSGLLQHLATQFFISTKAVRDIWNLRAWTRTTEPYWTTEEADKYVHKHAKVAATKRRVGRAATPPTSVAYSRNVQAPTEPDLPHPMPFTSFVASPHPPAGPAEDARTVTAKTTSSWIIETVFVADDFNALLTEWEQIQASLICQT